MKFSRPQTIRTATPRAFTVVELLVVIGIICILAGFLLPMIVLARARAAIATQRADFQTISIALSEYHHDFGAYPLNGATGVAVVIPPPSPGLADFLLGSGFQTEMGPDGKPRGNTYGPYLQPGLFHVITVNNGSDPHTGHHVVDRWGGPVLFYPRRAATTSAAGQNGALGPITIAANKSQGLFGTPDDMLENYQEVPISVAPHLCYANWGPIRAALGDLDNDNYINSGKGEHLAWDGDFILISGGPQPAAALAGMAFTGNWGFDSWGTALNYKETLSTPYSAQAANKMLADPSAARFALQNTCHDIFNFYP